MSKLNVKVEEACGEHALSLLELISPTSFTTDEREVANDCPTHLFASSMQFMLSLRSNMSVWTCLYKSCSPAIKGLLSNCKNEKQQTSSSVKWRSVHNIKVVVQLSKVC
ncbi:hypothetical protein Salat_2419100 [Sesamum alatum]|uniref:Uncharacterized protein n=1 Tax=Sesamum alatum TaxID=300844 RepID=A0AAE2CFD0_9LAMI|nr:hypothetical protein Salat_2419100 [Sesamum alatum]